MSDNTQNISSADSAGASSPEQRVRTGEVRVRKRRSPSYDNTITSTQDVDEARAKRLERRENRKARRLARKEERQEIRNITEAEGNDQTVQNTNENNIDSVSAAKIAREQRRQARAERRKKRAEQRDIAKQSGAPRSSSDKLKELFDKPQTNQKPSYKTDPDNDMGDDTSHSLTADVTEQSLLGAETVGAGQTDQKESAVDRITNKLKKASQERATPLSGEKAAARLSRVLKKVSGKNAEKGNKNKVDDKEKKPDTKHAFLAALTKHLVNDGLKDEHFTTLELTATSEKYKADVTKLQKRSETFNIRIIKDITTTPQSSIKTPSENVGHIFNKILAGKNSQMQKNNIFPFSECILPIMREI